MFRLKSSIAILALMSLGACADTRAQASASEEETVRSLDDQERIAALKRDIPALERLWSQRFTVNAPNNEVVVGKRAVLDTFVRGGVINFSSFDRHIEYISVEGDFAVIMGAETVRSMGDAPTAGLVAGQTTKRRFTNIWKREEGTWRLFWRHANVIPAAKR